jgi:IS5 family transposase
MTNIAKYTENLAQIRELARLENGKFLQKLNQETDWQIVENIIKTQINELSSGYILDINILTVYKITLLGEIYKLEDKDLLESIIKRTDFKNFVGIENETELPDIITFKKFKILLRRYDIYDELLDAVFDKALTDEHESTETGFIPLSQNEVIDKKIAEIEERIKLLHLKNLSPVLQPSLETAETEGLKDKLAELGNQVKSIVKTVEEKKETAVSDSSAQETILKKLDDQILEKLQSIEKRLEQLDQIKTDNELQEKPIVEVEETKKKLEDIRKEQDFIVTPEIPAEKTEDTFQKEVSKLSEIPQPEVEKPTEETEVKPTGKEPFIITPKAKTVGVFNDANLTEDYEFGYRFYELGFKTGFFNIKVDKNDEASRIATAEFFPNTFWAAVKQRSRWIAGICFQNWRAHKWKGNIVTKYFLFRDRKSLFTFIGAFLSNIVFLYFLYAVIARALRLENAYSLVGHSSVLWHLMIANLVFMISRAAHRFAFTYNWYGFKYAFFSFFRLILDTFINFIAIIRSISVYRKTKKQVVWDATSHY